MTSASARTHRIVMAAAAVLTIAAGPAYLEFEGVKGETKEKGKGGEIEIQSWSWGETRTAAEPKSKGKVEYSWKVEEGEAAPPAPGEAEITLKTADEAHKVSDVTLKRGTMAAEAEGLATGKRQHKPLVVTKPIDKGSLTAIIPAGLCQVGARYERASLSTEEGVYRMRGVTVTDCVPRLADADGDGVHPMETISLNYEEVK